MKIRIVSGIMLALLLITLLEITVSISPESAALLVHNIDTKEDFATIQEAIDDPDTLDGHTIEVDAGIYHEHIVVTKPISLIGESENNTVIDGNGTGTVVQIIASNVNFTGFTIRNSGRNSFDSGIYLDHSSGSNISHNNIINNQAGVWTKFSSNNVVCRNNIADNDVGGIILGMESSKNTVCENIVTNNGCGIWLGRASNTILRGNIMTDNMYGFGVSGRALLDFVHEIDTSNTIDDKPIYYFVNMSKLIINPKTFPNVGYLALVNSTDITIEDLTLANNAQGILLASATECVVRNLNAVNNICGIGLYFSSNNWLYGNTLRNSEDCGVWLLSSSQNIFYHNNFINNTKNVESEGSSNIWDNGYPTGGNFWSDYEERYPEAEELDTLGIWDTPYIIDENDQDNYPLMELWSPKPPSPLEALEELIQTVESWNLDKGIKTSLTSKLRAAHRLLNMENQNAPVGQLTAVMNQVEALRHKKLTIEQAEQITAEAQRITDLIKG